MDNSRVRKHTLFGTYPREFDSFAIMIAESREAGTGSCAIFDALLLFTDNCIDKSINEIQYKIIKIVNNKSITFCFQNDLLLTG